MLMLHTEMILTPVGQRQALFTLANEVVADVNVFALLCHLVVLHQADGSLVINVHRRSEGDLDVIKCLGS